MVVGFLGIESREKNTYICVCVCVNAVMLYMRQDGARAVYNAEWGGDESGWEERREVYMWYDTVYGETSL